MSEATEAGNGRLVIDVVSDVVCPWCFLGKRRLETAIALADVAVAVRWRPFQLDPTIPREGKSRRDYLEAKFGKDGRIEETHARLTEMGRAEGVDFAFDRIEVSPNTLDAHRLIRWAAEDGLQTEVVSALFRAYFTEGRDIGDPAVLAAVAEEAGMDGGSVAARLSGDGDAAAVEAEIRSAQQMGITGVPTFIIAERYALVGAQPAETFAQTLADLSKAASAR